MEPHVYIKWATDNTVVKGLVVDMLNIRKSLIPSVMMFGFVHSQDIHNHLVDHLCMSIGLGVEGNQFGVHHQTSVGPKSTLELYQYEIMVHGRPK